jgi:protein-S-isoprenylcysteine O-methyltransferase Ste14
MVSPMTMTHYFDWFLLVALACLLCLGFGRGVMLYRRGVRVIVSVPDFLFLVCFFLWIYEIVAYAWPLRAHIFPHSLGAVIVDAAAFKVAGTMLSLAGLAIYGFALRAMGASWRVGIDRDTPGGLVTGGIFAWTRNPIYVSLDLLAIDTFLIQGRLIFLLFAFAFAGIFHFQIRREESFLAEAYGEEYREYCARVPRYVKWQPISSLLGRKS